MNLFTSVDFALCLALVFAVWTLLRLRLGRGARGVLFGAINALFLIGIGGMPWRAALALLAVALLIFGAAAALRALPAERPGPRRLIFLLTLTALLAVFGVAKYHLLANAPGLREFAQAFALVFSLARPIALVGISYLTFKAIHFLVDVYQGALVEFTLITYLNYLFHFPLYFSGPIDRYPRFASAEVEAGTLRLGGEKLSCLLARFGLGLFKKMVVATLLARWSVSEIPLDKIPATPWLTLALGCYAYTLYIFFDFSGYCDMAISTAKLLGFSAPENFRQPYLSLSIQEFWTRWHISLSEWIRDYLFYPLMRLLLTLFPGSRGPAIPALSVATAFALAGVWHGDHWHDLYYGIGHGAALGTYLIYSDFMKKNFKKGYQRLRARVAYQTACRALTLSFVAFNNVLLCDQGTAVLWRLLGKG